MSKHFGDSAVSKFYNLKKHITILQSGLMRRVMLYFNALKKIQLNR